MLPVISMVNLELVDALFLRNLRNSKGDSAGKVCYDLNINRTYLYSVENGEKRLSDDMFNKILMYYQVDYDKGEDIYHEAYNLTIKSFESFVLKDDKSKKECLSLLECRKDKFLYSRAFIFMDLIEAILNLLSDRESIKPFVDKSNNYLSVYDNNIACIYGVIYGFTYGIYKNIRNSKDVIFKIYESRANRNLLPIVKGMFYYQLGRLVYEERNYIKAIHFFEEAIESLQASFCIERVYQVKIEIANSFLYLSLFNEAEIRLMAILDDTKKYGFTVRARSCLNNLAYIYLLTRQYDKCITFVNIAKHYGSTLVDLNYYYAYSIYKTKPKDEARSIVYNLLQTDYGNYTNRMIKLIRACINDNINNIDYNFRLLKKDIIKLQDSLEIKFLYEMIISYYADNDPYKCSQCVKEYFDLNEFRASN